MRTRAVALILMAALVAGACASTTPTNAGDVDLGDTRADEVTTTTGAQPVVVPNEFGVALQFGAVTERSIDIDADGRNTTAAIDSMNAFAVDLYREVGVHSDGNIVLSPYSVSVAMSMIYAGANGATQAEMADVLHAAGIADWHEGINAYDLSLDARTVGSPTEWNSVNKVWTRPDISLLTDYLDVLTGAYGSPLAVGDFASNADGERAIINKWVASETNDLIPELFPEGSLDSSTAMVLVNAVALDAPWEFPFDPTQTRTAPFTRVDGSTVDVEMMRYDEFLPTGWGDDYQAVELPYGGGALSMVVIVPNNIEEFEADLTAARLDAIVASINDGGIHLRFPKWTSRTAISLNETLAALGMPSAFGSDADFGGMTNGGGLWLALVQHEAFIEVDEAGTRAAAATGGAMADSHGPSISVDRPFLYLIRDKNAGTILFMGRVLDPTEAAN